CAEQSRSATPLPVPWCPGGRSGRGSRASQPWLCQRRGPEGQPKASGSHATTPPRRPRLRCQRSLLGPVPPTAAPRRQTPECSRRRCPPGAAKPLAAQWRPGMAAAWARRPPAASWSRGSRGSRARDGVGCARERSSRSAGSQPAARCRGSARTRPASPAGARRTRRLPGAPRRGRPPR
ncbi:unnamed protein product, partial [Prorocentrum cordatum]